MAKNEGTVTIPIDRYLELTKFVENILANNIIYLSSPNEGMWFVTVRDDDFIAVVKKDNEDFSRHNSALQKRIADFNSKPWYQRVFKSKV